LAVSAANLLTSQALPDTDFHDPGKVLSRLNDVFQMDKQDGKYFTIWYGVYRRGERTLAYCNAAHPPPLVWSGPSAEAATLAPLKTTDPLIGMLPAGTPYETRTLALGPYAFLLVYSDGAFEIESSEGVQWKHQDFVAFLATLPRENASLGERLLTHVRQRHGSDLLADDFSVLEVRF
jgi:phosphoserine phosphatase RsbU/P